MTWWAAAMAWLVPESVKLTLVSLRALPVVFLCPPFGGALAPVPVRLAVILALAVAVRPHADPGHHLDGELAARCIRELGLGLTMGLGAALPFEAARIGGRLIDLFRGTSAEASLPVAGHRESASGELLYQLLLAMVMSSGVLPVMFRALARSYLLVPPGLASSGEPQTLAASVGIAMATGLAVAAPVLLLCWTVDGALGLLTRLAPGFPALDVAAPARILGGAGLLWVALGLVCDRLLAAAVATPALWASLMRGPGE